MRIGIDARAILNPEKNAPTGVANYVWQLVKNLLEIDKENQYILFFDFKVRDKDVKRFTQPNVKIKFFPFSDYKKYMPAAYSEILGMATFAREKMDVLHTTSPLYRVPATYRGKIVTTFYDFASYRLPELFPRLRGVIDMERQRFGRFLLLGSVSPALMKHVSESLAGRLSLVELSPFTLAELPDTPLEELWLRGGFPDGGV